MLIGPLNAQSRASVVSERVRLSTSSSVSSPRVATSSVVLRVEKQVSVVSIVAALTVAIIGAGRVLQIHISSYMGSQQRQHTKG
jgi:hypothetical protein